MSEHPTAADKARRAKEIAEDVEGVMDRIGPGVGSLALAVSLLADALVQLAEEKADQ